MAKAFYVSPFIDMAGGYTVHVDDAPATFGSASTSGRATPRSWRPASSSAAAR